MNLFERVVRILKEVDEGANYRAIEPYLTKDMKITYNSFKRVCSEKDSVRTYLCFHLLTRGFTENDVLALFKSKKKYRSLKIAKHYLKVLDKVNDPLVRFILRLKKKGIKNLDMVLKYIVVHSECCDHDYFPKKFTKKQVDRVFKLAQNVSTVNQLLIALLDGVDSRIVAKILGVRRNRVDKFKLTNKNKPKI